MEHANIHNINIDTHEFKVRLDTIEEVRSILTYIEDNVDIGTFDIYTTRFVLERELTKPMEDLDISKLPEHLFKTPLLIESYLTSSVFRVEHYGTRAFSYKIRRENNEYYIIFEFIGLTQYDYDGSINDITYYRRDMRDMVFSHIDRYGLHMDHMRLEIAVDIIDEDFFKYDIIKENGLYRSWYALEVRERNRYSKSRIIQDGNFVNDRARSTNQIVIGMYDKKYKNNLDIDIIRIEYKLYKKGIDFILVDGNIDSNKLKEFIERFRIMKFGNRNISKRVMDNYLHDLRYDDRGNHLSDTSYYKRRKKMFPKLNKYMIDEEWLRDVEDVIIDNLYT